MALDQAGLQLIADGVSQYVSDLNKADDKTNSFYKTLGSSDKSANAFQKVITGALIHVGAALVDFAAQGAKAIGGFVKESVNLAGDFESGMKEFQSVAGKGIDTKGLKQFRDLFLKIGKELPVSTSEVQLAATEMIKGGIDPATIAAGGLRQNIQFAAAAMGGDLVKAAEISSKIMGGWAGVNATAADKAAFLTHATDMLAKAANASSTDVEGLSQGIFNAQGIARTAGVSFDDLTTTLAELAPRFASSSEAGNSLKNMIVRLQPTTQPAIDAMTALGIYTEKTGSAFYDAQGNFVGFERASQILQDSLKGLTKEQQAATLQQIFGNDAMGSAAALAELGAKGYQNMAGALNEANGVADAAAIKQQGFNVSLDNVKGSIEAMQITIGTALLPVLGDLLDNYITPGVNNLTAFAETFLKMVPAIAASNDPLQTFLNALKVAAPGMLDTITAIENVKDKISVVAEYLQVNVVPVLSDVADWLQTNIPLAAQATADFWNNTLYPALVKVKDFLVNDAYPAFATAVDWLKTNIPAAAKTTADFWGTTLYPTLKKINDYIQDNIFVTFSELAEKYLKNITKSSDTFSASWNSTLLPALQKVGAYIGQQLNQEWAKADVWLAAVQKTGELFMAFWNNVLWPGMQKVGTYLKDNLGPFFSDLGVELDRQVGPAIRGIVDWFGKLTSGIDGTSNAIQDNISWLKGMADSFRNLELPAWLQPGSPTPLEIGLIGIGKAIQGVVPGLSAMGAGMKEVGTQITDAFVNTDIVDMLTSLGDDAMAGFGKGLKSGLRGVMSIIDSAANSVEDAFKGALDAHSPSQRMVPIGEWVIQGFVQGMQDELPVLTTFVDSFGADLIGKMGDIADQIQGVIADAFGATASIDRQAASNLDKLKDVLPEYLDYTKGALAQAQSEAQRFEDPAQGAKYYAMKSKQILEYAKLQKDLADAETAEDRARIQQQMLLINAAQSAEIAQFNANQQSAQGPLAGIAGQINDIMKTLSGQNLTDDQIHMVDMLAGLFQQLSAPQSNPYANPTTTMPNVTNSQTINMPVYTNQSPAVVRDSMAVMGASLL